jgi:hypothetical protein
MVCPRELFYFLQDAYFDLVCCLFLWFVWSYFVGQSENEKLRKRYPYRLDYPQYKVGTKTEDIKRELNID